VAVDAPILVVDDDREIRETITLALEASGYTVVGASDGCEACRWLREHGAPSLILLDLMMPRMDGEELLRALERDDALRAVPVVIVSGDPSCRERAAELRAAGCLPKPVLLRDLEAAVERFAVSRSPTTRTA